MPVNFKCDITQKCQFTHQEKKMGDPGLNCSNNCQQKLKVKNDKGKVYDFDVCPRHYLLATQKKIFKYFDEMLTVEN